MPPPTKKQKIDPINNTKPADVNDTKIQLNPELSHRFLTKPKLTTGKICIYCRDYIWGTCYKNNSQCRFLHVRDINYMKITLQFCHDFQNIGCKWPNCSYLHTSKETKLFLDNGILPQTLLDRYAEMEAKVASYPGGLTATHENSICEQNPVNFNQPPPINLVFDHTKPPPIIPNSAAATEYIGLSANGKCWGSHEAQSHQNYIGEQTPININQPPSLINMKFDHTKPPPIISIPAVASEYIGAPLPPADWNIRGSQNAPTPHIGEHIPNINQQQSLINLQFDHTKPPPKIPKGAAATEHIGPPAKRNCTGSHKDTSNGTNNTHGTQENSIPCDDCFNSEFSINGFNKKIKNLEDVKDKKRIIYQQKIAQFIKHKKHLVSEVGMNHTNIIEKDIEVNNSNEHSSLAQTNETESVPPISSELQTTIEKHFVALNGTLINGNQINTNGGTTDMSSTDALISDTTDTFIIIPKDNGQADMTSEILEPEPNRQVYEPSPNFTSYLQHQTPSYIQANGETLMNGNEMNSYAATTDMPLNNAFISPLQYTLAYNQTKMTPLVQNGNGQANMEVEFMEPELNHQIYNPMMPPMYMPYLQHQTLSYIQPNESPIAVPPIMNQQYILVPFQSVSHPGCYPTVGGPGPVSVTPFLGMPGPGFLVPGYPHLIPIGMPQTPSCAKPFVPPLPSYLPPQKPPPPPEDCKDQ